MFNAAARRVTLFRSCARTSFCLCLTQPRALAAFSVVLGMFAGLSSAHAEKSLGLGIEASITADDNVTRGYGEGNVLSDQFLGVNLSKSLQYPLSTHTRVALLGFAGVNGYFEYNGLSHYYAGVQGEFQYRPSGSFYAPTLAFAVRTAIEEYQSEVRDSYRSSVWFSVRWWHSAACCIATVFWPATNC